MAQPMSRAKKAFIIGSVAVLSLAGAGVAYAYWTSTGTGVGEAQTAASAATFEIASDPAVGDLAPGSDGQTVAFTVTNPGPGTLYLGTVTARIALENGDPWLPAAGCLASYYSVIMTELVSPGPLAEGADRGGSVTVTMSDSPDDQDACQGETVPLLFAASSVEPN